MNIKRLARLLVGLCSIVLISAIISASTVSAQTDSAQATSSTSDLYGASNQSSFQDAGSSVRQQGSTLPEITSRGGSSVLNQVNNGKITVSGAPAYQGVQSNNNSTIKLWFSAIFFLSALGLMIMYVYSRLSTKKQPTQRDLFIQEAMIGMNEEIAVDDDHTNQPDTHKELSATSIEKSASTSNKKTKSKKKKKNHR